MALALAPLGHAATSEARDLLALMHDEPRHWATVSRDLPVSAAVRAGALLAAQRRAAGAPIQYAAGRAAFRTLSLAVDERVLIPRPETEILVDLVLRLMEGEDGGVIVDVGTGSGAIALSLAVEGRFDLVIGTDVSTDALVVARRNSAHVAARCRARVEMRAGALLAPVSERAVRAVVSNPPYIAFDEAPALPASVRDWEPAVALFSDEGGMAMTARLIREAADVLAPRGVVALEVDSRRAADVAHVVESHGAFDDVHILKDLTGRDRFMVARRREERG